jgi:hypothetical protein
MTIGELKTRLAELQNESALGDDTPLILSKDAEGNGFSPLAEMTVEFYAATSTWSGELDDDEGVESIVLWPVN